MAAGTFIASLLVRRYSERVASLYLLDPVCMGM
jgi:pimeloyl-ACP methyl ester carboxylesterase